MSSADHPDNGDLHPQELPGEEPMEVEAPRRAASAQFIVDSEAGSEASLRAAMDPANQSLAEALRLSYRVLQVVILVLVVLFLFSGWKTVREDQTGVLTVWGRIVEVGGSRALEPGLKFSRWPYPAGEFILFKEENRGVDPRTAVGEEPFWPRLPANASFEEAVNRATIHDRLRPGRDGALLTAGGDLAHLQLSARYAVADPVRFVEHVDVERGHGDALVSLALQRAVVHTGATLSLEQVVDSNEVMAAEVQQAAQAMLDELDSGIVLQSVSLPRTSAPLAIRKTLEELQQARVQVEQSLEQARRQANETLSSVAGTHYQELMRLIEQYQEAADGDDESAAEAVLAAINQLLESPEKGGVVAQIIDRAYSYRSQVESTLGSEARRFAGLLPRFRASPDMVVSRLWMETYGRVLAQENAEIIYAPYNLASMSVQIEGSEELARRRARLEMLRREAETTQGFILPFGQTRRAGDITPEGQPGRQLDVDPETGRVRSMGEQR